MLYISSDILPIYIILLHKVSEATMNYVDNTAMVKGNKGYINVL